MGITSDAASRGGPHETPIRSSGKLKVRGGPEFKSLKKKEQKGQKKKDM